MAKRYFYENPLKAAWMTYEFKFKFGMQSGPDPFYSGPFGFRPLSVEDLVNASWKRPIYLHPDCHAMLEPQEGDIGAYTDRFESCLTWNQTSGGYWENDEGSSISRKDIQIIRRNGKAFFMPEIEEI